MSSHESPNVLAARIRRIDELDRKLWAFQKPSEGGPEYKTILRSLAEEMTNDEAAQALVRFFHHLRSYRKTAEAELAAIDADAALHAKKLEQELAR